jgi:hypothetical protein
LVNFFLPRPPDVTILDFYFTHIAGVKNWYRIWNFKDNFSNATWCLRKHGGKSLCLHAGILRTLSTFVVTCIIL